MIKWQWLQNRDGVAILVAVKTSAKRPVRVNVTLPEDELERIDQYAKAHGQTRSGFLTQAARFIDLRPGRPETCQRPASCGKVLEQSAALS